MIVYLSPVGLDARSWGWLPRPKHYEVHQFPGFGRPRAPIQPTMATLADEVAAEHDGPLDLIGVSMGGMVALNVALRHPHRVRSVLVACTGATADPAAMLQRAAAAEQGGMGSVVEPTLKRWFTPETMRRHGHSGVAYARETLLNLDARAFADGWRAIATHDTVEHLGALQMLVTAVAGERDTASPPERSQLIADAVARGRFVTVADSPHMIHLERPREFADVIAEHLAAAAD